MCGIAGFLNYDELIDTDIDSLHSMASRIKHRGPNDSGIWVEKKQGIGLAHVRLSILDLSFLGRQPMESSCKRYVIVFNGEIYNHNTLRLMLEAEGYIHTWRSSSDTETLLECISKWGVVKTLQSTVGMFSLALWDIHENELILARDRLGEKPLYWGWFGQNIVFGSELKSLRDHPSFKFEVDRNALSLFLKYNYVPAPYSIYKGIEKLQPGSFVRIKRGSTRDEVFPQSFWNINSVIEKGIRNQFDGSPNEAVDLLEKTIMQSIEDQMIADVQVGAFLSGGVDSSTIVALMQLHNRNPVKTFTVGFNEKAYNEADSAKKIAKHLGTEHTELYVTSKDALNVIPKLSSIYCEPFADSSQIPTFMICKLASENVTVALSGDCGDEVFGGYAHYQLVPKVWKFIKYLPYHLRSVTTNILVNFPLPHALEKLIRVLPASSHYDLYQLVMSQWKNPVSCVLNSKEVDSFSTAEVSWPNVDCFEHWMMAVDTNQYMVDDILVKVDRAAMASGLETRVPYLDHRVVELAWKFPVGLKFRNGVGKWCLREIMDKHIPKKLTDRPKKGFSVPIGEWLRTDLKEWADVLLNEERLRSQGYFEPKIIRKLWHDHLSRKKDNHRQLWNIIVFQSWLEENQLNLSD